MDYKKISAAWAKRRGRMIALRAKGRTFEQIAKMFGITRQRVEQIVRKK